MTERILRLWPHASAAREVRTIISDVCARGDLRGVQDTAALLASELAADALPRVDGLLTMAITTDAAKVAVAVLEDARDDATPDDDERELRRSLLDTLATRWGFRETRAGAALWFQLDSAADATNELTPLETAAIR